MAANEGLPQDMDVAPNESAYAHFDVASLSATDIDSIKNDLVRAVVERAKSIERDMHNSHGNIHSSNNSGLV
tara:strand:- start:113 stop:328 length:216 start_codon:yes stop_codon:yes gene_type:complete